VVLTVWQWVYKGGEGQDCGGEGQIFGDDWLVGEEGKRTLLVGEVTAAIQWGIFLH